MPPSFGPIADLTLGNSFTENYGTHVFFLNRENPIELVKTTAIEIDEAYVRDW
jgi:hypothetical protein